MTTFPELSQAAISEGLEVATALIALGIPIFTAQPAVRDGQWDPTGGTGRPGAGCGYHLPGGWQQTSPDVRVLDPSAPGWEGSAWRPGWALCAVMGHGLDLLDTDPRHEGDLSRQGLIEQGLWPTAPWAVANTPSGGIHEFIPSLDLRSRDNFRPGLDYKGGLVDGSGRGFAFIAPTVRLSKTTGLPVAYTWNTPPTPELTASERGSERVREVISAGRMSRSGGVRPAASGLPAWLQTDPPGQPCRKVLAEVATLTSALNSGESRHQATRSSLTRLMRLRQQGHSGVPQAVEQVTSDFKEAVTEDHDRMSEVERLIQGSWGALTFPRDPKKHAVCACQMERLRVDVEHGEVLGSGRTRTTDRKVMSYLVMAATRKISLMVTSESQRKISAAIDIHQPTVAKSLSRLRQRGLIEYSTARGLRTINRYLIKLPSACANVSMEDLPSAGTSIDTSVRVYTHPLFGTGGLGGAVVETFACLSENRRPIRAGWLVPVRPRKNKTLPIPRVVTKRSIPKAVPGNEGRTPRLIAAHLHRNPSTVRRHLHRLTEAGLVYQRDGLWWRYWFNPDAVAAELGVQDTASEKRSKHAHERYRQAEQFCDLLDQRGNPQAVRVIDDGVGLIVKIPTGEIIWQGPVPLHWPADEEENTA